MTTSSQVKRSKITPIRGRSSRKARTAAIRGRYPRLVTLSSHRTVELRLMGDADRDDVLAFAHSLPPDSLLYLQANITDPETVDAWLTNTHQGRTITVLAYEGKQLIGEGSLHHSATTWTRHIGEIRLLIAPSVQHQGLGRILASEIDAVAKLLKLQMLSARMTLDQVAAQSVFRRLGFQREAVLWDYVIAADGKTRNLLVATKRL